jgi:hypothetical protein
MARASLVTRPGMLARLVEIETAVLAHRRDR